MKKTNGGRRGLLDGERRFRLLVEGVVDYAIYMLDPNGIITNWNAGAKRIKGYEADEVVGRHFQMFYPEEDRAAGLPARSLEDCPREREVRGRGLARPQGRHRSSSRRSCLMRSMRTTSLLASPRSRATSPSGTSAAGRVAGKASDIFGCSSNGVTDYALYMLDPNGIVTNWNAGAQRIKGYLPTKSSGNISRASTPTAIAPPAVPARALHGCTRRAASRRKAGAFARMARFFWASVVIDPIRDDEGRLIGFAKITRDITERREAQQTLEKAPATAGPDAKDGRAGTA